MTIYYYYAPNSKRAQDMIISDKPINGLRLYRAIEVDTENTGL